MFSERISSLRFFVFSSSLDLTGPLNKNGAKKIISGDLDFVLNNKVKKEDPNRNFRLIK